MFLLYIYPNSTFQNIQPGVPDKPFHTIATARPLFTELPRETVKFGARATRQISNLMCRQTSDFNFAPMPPATSPASAGSVYVDLSGYEPGLPRLLLLAWRTPVHQPVDSAF
jgi:hypothetical protein